jgi:hypothetical protein
MQAIRLTSPPEVGNQPSVPDGLPRAQALAEELDWRWKGQEACDEGPVVIDSVELTSPPESWPPRLRIRFTSGGRPGVWEDEWDSVLWSEGPIPYAAEMFASIAWTAFLEMQDTGSRPDGLHFLDE